MLVHCAPVSMEKDAKAPLKSVCLNVLAMSDIPLCMRIIQTGPSSQRLTAERAVPDFYLLC